MGSVLQCSEKIQKFDSAPLEYSPYDEIIDLLREEQDLNDKVLSAHNAPKINLIGEYATIGRGFGTSASRTALSDNGKERTSVGLEFTIPIGKAPKDREEVLRSLNRYRYESQRRNSMAKIEAFHEETTSMVKILQEVVANQKQTHSYLSKSLKVSLKKYKQARIGVEELIAEQDAKLQSKLSEIDAQLRIIHTLIDYFGIYTNFPCTLNRISP